MGFLSIILTRLVAVLIASLKYIFGFISGVGVDAHVPRPNIVEAPVIYVPYEDFPQGMMDQIMPNPPTNAAFQRPSRSLLAPIAGRTGAVPTASVGEEEGAWSRGPNQPGSRGSLRERRSSFAPVIIAVDSVGMDDTDGGSARDPNQPEMRDGGLEANGEVSSPISASSAFRRLNSQQKMVLDQVMGTEEMRSGMVAMDMEVNRRTRARSDLLSLHGQDSSRSRLSQSSRVSQGANFEALLREENEQSAVEDLEQQMQAVWRRVMVCSVEGHMGESPGPSSSRPQRSVSSLVGFVACSITCLSVPSPSHACSAHGKAQQCCCCDPLAFFLVRGCVLGMQ